MKIHTGRLPALLSGLFAFVVAAQATPPNITNTNLPADVSLFLGQNTTLSVSASSATPMGFQWFFNGASLGQTNQSLTLVGAVTNESGGYSVVITNASGATTSRVATVTITEPFSGTRGQSGLVNLAAYRGQTGLVVNATLTGNIAGTVWGTGIYTDDSYLPTAAVHAGFLTNTEFGTVTAVIAPGLNLYTNSIMNGVTSGSFGAWPQSYVLRAVVPTFDTQPLNRAAFSGEDVTYTAGAFYRNPFRYQWFHNGVEIPGETNATLNLPAISGASGGAYAVQARTTAGTNASEFAQLVIVPADSADPVVPDSGNAANLPGVAGTVSHVGVMGSTAGGNVWGSGIYTIDSSVARAAVHAGFLSPGQTGVVSVVILPGQNSYAASSRNGIQTLSYPAYFRSFAFVGSPVTLPPFCTNLTVTVSAGTTNCNVSNSIAGWWKAENNMADASGNNNGSSPYSQSYVAGAIGQAFKVGTYDSDRAQLIFTNYHRVDLGALSQLYAAPGFTMAGWVRVSDYGYHYMFSFPANIPSSRSTNSPFNSFLNMFGCQFDASLAVNFSMGLENGVVITNNYTDIATMSYVPKTNLWVHLAFTWNNVDGNVRTYTNGVLAQTTANPFSIGHTLPTQAQRSHLGTPVPAALGVGVQLYKETNAPIYYNEGITETQIDEFQLYNRALTGGEIALVYGGSSAVLGFTSTNCAVSTNTTADMGFCSAASGRLHVANAGPGQVQLSWSSQGNAYYVLQGTYTLQGQAWTNVSGPSAGNNGTMTVPEPVSAHATRFYRLLTTE